MPKFTKRAIASDHPGRSPALPGAGGSTIMHWACLAIILLLAIGLRMDDLAAWRHQPTRAFHNEEPILVAFDGYYYLSLARDLQQGIYEPEDALRGVPTAQKRPWPPPLLSMMAAGLSWALSISLNWAGVLLPPALGLTLAIPLYLFGRLYGGRIMALVSVCVGLCANYYIYRSNPGWFDTDCMNVMFAFLIPYLYIRFGLEPSGRKYWFLAGGLATSAVFLLWWDQARLPAALISAAPLTIVLLLYYRPKGRKRIFAWLSGFALLAAVLIWQGPNVFWEPLRDINNTLTYIGGEATGDFPSTSPSVAEQTRLDLHAMANKTSGDPISLLIGIFGLGWLGFFHRQKVLALLPLLVLGCLSMIFARRFLIFLNPFFALGLGFVAQQIWKMRPRHIALRYGAPILAVLFCFLPVKSSLSKVYWPKEIPPLIAGFNTLSSKTPEDAVIWAWWDHGYPLRYWGQRATINDGSLHSGERTVCNAIPLAAPSQQLSANFIHFYTIRGVEGLNRVLDELDHADRGMDWVKRILSAGPRHAGPLIAESGMHPVETWLTFFFPPQRREVYLFLDLRLTQTSYWWYWFGTWEISDRVGRRPQFTFVQNISIQGTRVEGPEIEADLANGWVAYRQNTFPLSRSYLADGADQTHTRYTAEEGLVLAMHKQSGTAALMDPTFARSTFGQLYASKTPDPAYFTLIEENYPYFQIWRVTPDTD